MLPDFASSIHASSHESNHLLCTSEHSNGLILDPHAKPMFSETSLHIVAKVDRSGDIPFSAFPKSNKVFGATSRKLPSPPDIAKGLGRSQRDQDLVSLCQFVQDSLRLSVFDRHLYLFDGPCWHRLDDAAANTIILDKLTRVGLGYCLTGSTISKIRSLLLMTKALHRDGEFSPPELCINFADGTLNVENGTFYPHTPSDDFTSFISVRYSDVCRTHDGIITERFIENLSNGDSRVRQQLFELIGVALSNLELKHFFVLVGESHTGKSQFGRFLAELLGHEAVGTIPDIHSFAKTFTSSVCEGKRLVSCMDLPDKPLPKDAVSIIKQIVGDDAVTIEAKYKNARTIYRKPLLLFASNHRISIPQIEEEQAFLNRMVLIPFYNPCRPDQMIPHLYQELLREAPYIISQAIDALQLLLKNNRQPTQVPIPAKFLPGEGDKSFKAMQVFFDTNCVCAKDGRVTTDDLYARFIKVGSLSMSYIEFSRAFRQIIEAQMTDYVCEDKHINGKRGYRGICLRTTDASDDILLE